MYDHPFCITGKRSNNAFSFEKRTNPTLYVPSLIEGGLDDVKIGKEVVFEDFESSTNSDGSERGILRSCVGLEHFLRMKHPTTGKPIVVVDNHNHAFYFWHEAWVNRLIAPGATLVHIDQHKDMREPSEPQMDFRWISDGFQMDDATKAEWLQKKFKYTNSVLNVGNYIPPAIKDGLVGEVVMVTGSLGADGHPRLTERPNIILNLDLDFWAPEMDYIDRNLKNRVARAWMERADLITIATSPFFMEQERAIEVLRELMN